jgi:hypothetical protein
MTGSGFRSINEPRFGEPAIGRQRQTRSRFPAKITGRCFEKGPDRFSDFVLGLAASPNALG